MEFEPDRLIAWRHFTANRWRYELTPTADGGTTVTETFDMSRADRVTDAVVAWAKFHERNREGIVGTLARLKRAGRGRRISVLIARCRGCCSRVPEFSRTPGARDTTPGAAARSGRVGVERRRRRVVAGPRPTPRRRSPR